MLVKREVNLSIQKRTNPDKLPCNNSDAIDMTHRIYEQLDRLVALHKREKGEGEGDQNIEWMIGGVKAMSECNHQMLVTRLDPFLDLLH